MPPIHVELLLLLLPALVVPPLLVERLGSDQTASPGYGIESEGERINLPTLAFLGAFDPPFETMVTSFPLKAITIEGVPYTFVLHCMQDLRPFFGAFFIWPKFDVVN